MPQLTLEQRSFLIRTFYSSGSKAVTLRLFATEFPERKVPTRVSLAKLVVKFSREHRIENLNPGRSGPKTTVRTQAKIAEVRRMVVGKKTSTRKVASACDISQTTARRIIRKDIKVKPYKLIRVQALSPADKQKRVRDSNVYLNLLRNIRLPYLFFSDECTFYADGTVNRNNCIAYDFQRPDWHQSERRLGAARVCVWAAMSSDILIGPYFFPATVNGAAYLKCLRQYAVPRIREAVGEDWGRVWFQQDGATSHRDRRVKLFLRQTFKTHTIGLELAHNWPPRSPDLNTCDYFLWAFLKDIVFNGPEITTKLQLKRRIRSAFDHVRAFKMQQLRNAVGQWRRRLRTCISNDGSNVDAALR